MRPCRQAGDVDPVNDLPVRSFCQTPARRRPTVFREVEATIVVARRHVSARSQQAIIIALVGFRRMARDGHGVVAIDAAVHVGDLNVGLWMVALMAMKVPERRGL